MAGEPLTPETPDTTSNAGDALPDFSLPDKTEVDESLYHDEEETATEEIDDQIDFEGEPSIRETEKTADELRGALDDKGGAYDPALHVYPPEKTAGGKWRRIPKKERDKMTSGEAPEPASNAENRIAAQTAAQAYAALHLMGFGVENGMPESQQDFVNLVNGIEGYLNSGGTIPISPRDLMLMSMLQYSFPIVQRETNAEKLKRFFGTIFGFFKKRKTGQKIGKNRSETSSQKTNTKA